MKALGKALSVELYNCNRDILNDVALVEQYLQEAALEAKATIVETVFHLFSPYGVSGVVVISESHLAIHTWPEYGYAAIDIFTCGTTVDPWVACHYLKDRFQAVSYEAYEIRRGRLDDIVKNSVNHHMLTPDYFSHKPRGAGCGRMTDNLDEGVRDASLLAGHDYSGRNVRDARRMAGRPGV